MANYSDYMYRASLPSYRTYGTKRDTHDYRDKIKAYSDAEIHRVKQLYGQKDLSGYMVSFVYDQGSLESCTANAVCAAYKLDLKKQPGYTRFNPSRLFLYYNSRLIEGKLNKKDTGVSIRDSLKAFNKFGVCEESKWPYLPDWLNEKPTWQCYNAAQGNSIVYERLLPHHDVRGSSNEIDIHCLKACILEDCPFVFGFNVYENFGDDSMRRNGWVMPHPAGTWKGGHAVMAVGYNDYKRCIKVLNSWGSNWGDNGYFYMPYDIIVNKHLCYDYWKISFARENERLRFN